MCESGDFRQLIGISEDEHIEFKEQLDLNLVQDKHKFAKSLASFANTNGGILVIGVGTDRKNDTRIDYASRITAIAGNLDIGRYHRIAQDLLYPSIPITFRRHPDITNSDRALVTAEVSSALSQRPILVTKTYSETLNGGTVFGYYRRGMEGVDNVRHAEIHALLQTGEQLKEVAALKESISQVSIDLADLRRALQLPERPGEKFDGPRD